VACRRIYDRFRTHHNDIRLVIVLYRFIFVLRKSSKVELPRSCHTGIGWTEILGMDKDGGQFYELATLSVTYRGKSN